jgi:ABC-2 type transport system permease protein
MPTTTRKPPSALDQLIDILLIELTNWRWSWRSLLIVATIAPLFSILALGFFARDDGSLTVAHILTGNVVLALMFGTMNNVQGHFTFMRVHGTLDYFATLPIQKPLLILAVVVGFLLLSLPSVLTTVLVGSWLLGVTLQVSPLVLLVVPLCALPLASLGALIGTSARTPQEANSISLLLTLLLVAIGPVIAPPDRLPDAFLTIGYASPATYAASAMRQTLIGPLSPRLALDLAALAAFTLLFFWLTARRMDWRER